MKSLFAVLLSSLIVQPSAFADGTPAVERGLAWLASQQRADGSWSTNAALNALPVLAFLSAGYVPGNKPYNATIDRGLRWLLTQQSPDGDFTAGGGMMYGHAIATLLLAEVAGMSRSDKHIRDALDRAVSVTLRAQTVPKPLFHEGGWRYFPDSTDSDLSVTAWQICSLRAANEAGVAVPRAVIERAVSYLRRCEHPQGGFGYQPGGLPNRSRTAAAMVALRICSLAEDPVIERGRRWLVANPASWDEEYFYHGAFFCAQAAVGFDDALLLKHQSADGHWPTPATCLDEAHAGPLYSTSMAVLALTARQGYLPVFAP